MRAFLDDNSLWKPQLGVFAPGSPLYNEEGGEILKGPRNFDAAKRLLVESGYSGQPVTCLAAQDLQPLKACGDVTADLLKRLGMNVDLAAVDWGTVVARQQQKSPPSQGGWNLYLNYSPGAVNSDPTANNIRADSNYFGWPNIPQVEAEISAWYDAKSFDEEKAAARRLNKAEFLIELHSKSDAGIAPVDSTVSLTRRCAPQESVVGP